MRCPNPIVCAGIPLLAVLLCACPPRIGDDDDGGEEWAGSCEDACLGLEEAALLLAGDALTSEEFRTICAGAPSGSECESCYSWIQDEALTPYEILWDCGCGLDVVGVQECTQDPELDGEGAQELLDGCLETCVEDDLAPP